MKKAFTFAELMISLVLISVLSAILYPTIFQFTPNTNKPLFKSAYRTLSNTVASITNDDDNTTGELLTSNELLGDTSQTLCQKFCGKMNTVPENNVNVCATLCNDNTITTTNGMKWYFYDYNAAGYNLVDYHSPAVPQANVFKIVVDVNSTNNQDIANTPAVPANLLVQAGDPFENGVSYFTPDAGANGIYSVVPGGNDANNVPQPNGTFNVNNLKAQDTFEILINLDGQIISMSPAAWANLEDDEQSDR